MYNAGSFFRTLCTALDIKLGLGQSCGFMSTVATANDTTVGDAKRPVQMSFDAAAPRSPRPWRPLLM
jgi:hypothetical protein